jgi:DNA-binding NarL/FixJ family response regulator
VIVLVLDGHIIFRQGIAAALAASPELEEVRQASSVAEVGEWDMLSGVDVVLVDTDLPGAHDLLRRLRGSPDPRALACARQADHERIIESIAAGAIGYLSKENLTPESVVAAVLAVGSGSGVLEPDALAGVLERISETSRTVLEPRGLTLSRLTEREQEVLRLLAAGHATREVAQHMSYSERTVKNLLHDVATKLNAKTRSQAVAFAIREGLI